MSASETRFLVDAKGRKTAVVLPVRHYERLLEDLHDLAVVAERRSEPAISLAELKARLKKNGQL
jgi:hypothetical protein